MLPDVGRAPDTASRSSMAGRASRIRFMRTIEAEARWKALASQPNAISGQATIARYIRNATKSPSDISPAATLRPPTHSRTSRLSPSRNPSSGPSVASRRARRRLALTYASLRSWNRSRSVSSRPYARTTRRPARFSWVAVETSASAA